MENDHGSISEQLLPYELFLKTVENCGISLFWDIDEDCDPEDTIFVHIEDTPDCAIEIDPFLEHMDIFMAFGYYDFSSWERENSNCLEEIEEDTYVRLLERRFESFLAENSTQRVSVWDDGCYMCRGYTARVGFQKCECSTEIIQEFLVFVRLFNSQYGSMDRESLQKEAIGSIAKAYGFSIKTLPFSICSRVDAVFSEELLDRSPTIYDGQEHILIHAAGRNSAISKSHWKMVSEIVDNVECYDDRSYFSDGKFLSVCTSTLFFQLPCQKGAEYSEELLIKKKLGLFLPFASDSMRQVIGAIDSQFSSNCPLVFTEGKTDWIHINHAWQQLASDEASKIKLHEYEKEAEMGNAELLNMCRALSKMDNPAPRIMLFDRDDQSINKQVLHNGSFRDWGNRVYSLILPVPPHRQSTPNICIEHFYTNEEIKTEQLISGVYRRLYLGDEFDSLGRAPQLNKLCHQTRLCGPGKISIIDSGVYDFSESAAVNYAMSKAAFAELFSSREISREAAIAFSSLLEAIRAVLDFDQKQYKSMRKH